MKGPRYQPFNDLPAAQYQGLLDDIAKRGIVEPIVVDENDVTIDGHQRRKAAADLHIECPRRVVEGLSEDEKQSLAIALNLYRRHLVGVERSKALQQLANLGMSVRRISDLTGTPKSTVHDALAQVSGSGHLEDPPATPPAGVDPETGEVVSASAPAGAAPVAPPSPRVEGKDGKSYPARKPTPTEEVLREIGERVDASDVGVCAAVSKELLRLSKLGLLDIDPVRAARVTPLDERDFRVTDATRWAEWFAAYLTELTDDRLRSVQ